MSLLGNIIWLICGGLVSGLGYIIGGIGMCLTIIGIPFGYQSIKLGIATFAPFGTELVEYEDANSTLRLVLNVLWLVSFGWLIALNHLFWAVLLGITIVGIPFAVQHLKLIPLAIFPFGRDLVRQPYYQQGGWQDPQYRTPAQVR
jgi:uncharacterized membrane protein YccF (DUF307 family)